MAHAIAELDKAGIEMQHAGRPLDMLRCMEDALRMSSNAPVAGSTREQQVVPHASSWFQSPGTWFQGPSPDRTDSRIAERNRRAKSLIHEYNKVAQVMSKQGKNTAARNLMEKAMALTRNVSYFTTKAERLRVRTGVLNSTASHLERVGELEGAMDCLRESLDIEEEIGVHQDPIATHMQLCTVLSQLGNHDEALLHAESAVQVISDQRPSAEGDDRLPVAFQLLAKEQEETGDHSAAVKTLQRGARQSAQFLGLDHPAVVKMKQSAKRAVKLLVHSTNHSRPTPGARHQTTSPSASTSTNSRSTNREQRQLAAEIGTRFPSKESSRSPANRLSPLPSTPPSAVKSTEAPSPGSQMSQSKRSSGATTPGTRSKLLRTIEEAHQFDDEEPRPVDADAFQATLLAEHPDAIQLGTSMEQAMQSAAEANTKLLAIKKRQELPQARTTPVVSPSNRPASNNSSSRPLFTNGVPSPALAKTIPIKYTQRTSERQAEAFLGYLSRMDVPEDAKPKWALAGAAPPLEPEKRPPKPEKQVLVEKSVMKAAEKAARGVAHRAAEAMWSMHCVKRLGKALQLWSGMVMTIKEERVKVGELDRQEHFDAMQIALDHSESQFMIRQRDGITRGTVVRVLSSVYVAEGFQFWKEFCALEEGRRERAKETEEVKKQKKLMGHQEARSRWDRFRLADLGDSFTEWHQWQRKEKKQRIQREREEAEDAELIAERAQQAEEEMKHREDIARREKEAEELRLKKVEEKKRKKHEEAVAAKQEEERKQREAEEAERKAQEERDKARDAEIALQRRIASAGKRALSYYVEKMVEKWYYFWTHLSTQKKQAHKVLRRVRLMLKNWEVLKCNNLWRSKGIEQQQRRELLAKVNRRMRKVRKRLTLTRWRELNEVQGDEYHSHEVGKYYWDDAHIEIWFRALQQLRRDRLVLQKQYKRTYAHMSARYCSGAFHLWLEQIWETQAQRKQQFRGARHYKKRLQAEWFYEWRPIYYTTRRDGHRVVPAMETTIEFLQEQIFDQWWEQTEQKNQRKDDYKVSGKHHSTYKKLRTWFLWKKVTRVRLEFAQKVDGVGKRMAFMNVNRAVNTWRTTTEQMKVNIETAWTSLLKMQQRMLNKAFTKWLAPVELQLSTAWKLTKVISCFKEKQLLWALNAWSECSRIRILRWQRSQGIFRHLLQQTLSRAYNKWGDNAWEFNHQRMQIRRSLLWGLERMLAEAWSAWCDNTVQRSFQHHEACTLFVKRFLNRRLLQAFNCWQENSIAAAEMLDNLRAMMVRMLKRKLSEAVAQWYDFAMEAIEQRQFLVKTLKALHSKELRRVFISWQDFVEDCEIEREIAFKVTRWMLFAKLGGALAAWAEWASLSKRHSELTSRMMRNLVFRGLREATCKWREEASIRRFLDEKRRQMLHRIFNRVTREAFESWLFEMRDRSRVVEKLSRAMARFVHRQLRESLDFWLEECYRMADELKATRRVLLMVARRMEVICLNQWRERADDWNMERHWASSACELFMQSNQRKALRTWYTQHQAIISCVIDQYQNMQKFRQGALFHTWLDCTRCWRHTQLVLSNTLARLTAFQHKRMRLRLTEWREWRGAICERVRLRKLSLMKQWRICSRRHKTQEDALIATVSTMVKRCAAEVESCRSWSDITKTFPRLHALCKLWRMLLVRSTSSVFERFVNPFQEACLSLSQRLSHWSVQCWDNNVVVDPTAEPLQEARRLALTLEALGHGGYDSVLHGWFAQVDTASVDKKSSLPEFNSFHDEGGARAQHFISALF